MRERGGTRLAAMVKDVRRALDGRRLIWFGTRGEDGEALLRLPELTASFAVTAPLRSARLDPECNVTLEGIAGERPDLDVHDIDTDASEAAREYRRRLLREVSSRCAVVPYRPAHLISTMAFSMTETMLLAGLFKDRQLAFEHKPWVETSLGRRGVETLGWRYVADEHRARVRRMADAGPLVLRASRASGGVGVVRVEGGRIDDRWPRDADGFVGVAAFLDRAVPVNLSGCVFANGVVHLHPASLQIIGEPRCTARPFGYCGNDFAAASELPRAVLDQLDTMARTVGRWLHSERYLGTFGIDALVGEGRVHFTEVNARFQGSSALSAEIARRLDLPDLFLENLAAHLGLAPEDEGMTVGEWAAAQAPVSHVVVHNTAEVPCRRRPGAHLPRDPGFRATQVLPTGVLATPGATICRLVLESGVTDSGFELHPETAALVDGVSACFAPAAGPERREVAGVGQAED